MGCESRTPGICGHGEHPSYMGDEEKYALNLGKTKDWYKVTLEHLKSWADRAEVPWRAIKLWLIDTLDKARALWPKAHANIPMEEKQKNW